MGLIKKAFNFVVSPSHSRTFALVGMLVLVSAVFLTVNQNQQQQTLKQRAAAVKPDESYVCDENLHCDASTINGACPADKPNKCLSSTNFFTAKNAIDSYPVVCCDGNKTYGDLSVFNESSFPTCEENLTCGLAYVSKACGSDKPNKCLSDTIFWGDKINDKYLACCSSPTSTVPAAPGIPAAAPLPAISAVDTAKCTRFPYGCTGRSDACLTPSYNINSGVVCSGDTCVTGNQYVKEHYPGKTCVDAQAEDFACWYSYACPPSAATVPDNSAKAPAAGIGPCAYPTCDVCRDISEGAGCFTLDTGVRGTCVNKKCTVVAAPGTGTAPAAGGPADTNNTDNTTTTTTTPKLFTCANQTGDFAGNYQCKTIINGTTQCDSGFVAYSPSAPYTGVSCGTNQGCCKQGATNQANLFTCQNQTGTYAGNYACADIINGTTQCPSNYTTYSPSDSFTGTSCGGTRGCCKQNAAASVTVPVNTVTLGLTLNAQDVPTTSDTITPSLTFYSNLAAPTKVTINASGPLQFNKTDVPGKKYSARVALMNLPKDKYFVIARKDVGQARMIAKAVFTVSSANGQVDAPTTTLVFGDITGNNDIDTADWNALKSCWRKTVASTPSCTSSDFDGSGVIDQVDFNTLMRGWLTWNAEGKNL